jgi:two-component system sensor histidine kinase UhpB
MKLFPAKTLLLIPAILFYYSGYCQKKFSPADTVSIRHSLNQANAFFKKSLYDSAIGKCNQVLQLTEKNNLKILSATAWDIIGEVMMANGKFPLVRRYDSLILPIATQYKDTTLIISVRTRAGVYLLEHGQNGEAAEHFKAVLDMRLTKEQSVKTAEVYSNMASIYMNLSKKNEAMNWFFKALRLYEKYDHHSGLGETYSNISSIYYLMGQTNDAIEFQKKSIWHREKQQDIQGLIIPHINIGQLYLLKDSINLSLDHLKRAVALAEKINNTKLRAAAYSGMSTFYIKTKQFAPALTWQNKSIALFEETDNKTMISRL